MLLSAIGGFCDLDSDVYIGSQMRHQGHFSVSTRELRRASYGSSQAKKGESSRIVSRYALICSVNKARAVDVVLRLIWHKVVW